MAVITKHLAASLRIINNAEDTVHSYHNIRPEISVSNIESFLQGVNMLRGESGGNAFLTITTELAEDDV